MGLFGSLKMNVHFMIIYPVKYICWSIILICFVLKELFSMYYKLYKIAILITVIFILLGRKSEKFFFFLSIL